MKEDFYKASEFFLFFFLFLKKKKKEKKQKKKEKNFNKRNLKIFSKLRFRVY